MSKIRSRSSIERIEWLPERYRSLNLVSHPKNIIGHPDFADTKKKIALFVDGCFWHQCPRHFRFPKTNVDFWTRKFAYGKSNERRTRRILRRHGWKIIRVWEHEIKKGRERA